MKRVSLLSLPSRPSKILLTNLLQIQSFFSSIVLECTHVFVCVCVYLPTYIPSWAHLNFLTCMFSGLTLTPNNKLMCYSIGWTASPVPNLTQLSTNACVGLRHHGLFLIQISWSLLPALFSFILLPALRRHPGQHADEIFWG